MVGIKNKNPGLLVHYGSSKYDPRRFRLIRNKWFKPEHGTGLWASPMASNWGWQDWCLAEEFWLKRLNRYFTFQLLVEARIYVIDSYEDLDRMPINMHAYGGCIDVIDFKEMKYHWDAIWMTVAGQAATRFSTPKNLYGWDCESVLVMNKDVIINKFST